MPEPLAGARPLLAVADVIKSHGAAFLQKYGSHLMPTQKKALRDLAVCRTSALGGHVERWSAYLLPVEYHHVVFTLPSELAELAASNASALYNLLMSSAADTLREVAANPKRLGAQIGVLMEEHTS